MAYVSPASIRALRERRALTQRDLAARIGVTDKAVSKWESGRGLPDISLVEPLAAALGVSIAELFSGELVENANRSANMMRSVFHVCPVCGNVVHAMGAGSFSCCGVQLPALDAEEPDESHALAVEFVDGELYVTLDHPMSKGHFVSFLAYVTTDRLQMRKLYPEQSAEARFSPAGSGIVYAYCNRHGLFAARVRRARVAEHS